MMWRLENLPVYSSAPTKVEARIFNLIRRALRQTDKPIRIPFSYDREVDVLIDEDSWVCVNNTNNDMPFVAWVGFESQGRSALHTPITCTKNYYHYAAGRIACQAMDEIEAFLTEHFEPAPVCMLESASRKRRVWYTSNEIQLSCV